MVLLEVPLVEWGGVGFGIHSLLIRLIKAYLLVAVGVTYSRYPWCYLRLRWWAGLGFGLGWGWGRV